MWEELMPVVITFVVTILGIVLTTIGTIVGIKAKELIKTIETKTGIEVDEKLAKEAVAWTEQVFNHLGGAEKFEKAKDRYILLLAERGVPLREEVIDSLIEQAVLAMKKGWNEGEAVTISFEEAQSLEPEIKYYNETEGQ